MSLASMETPRLKERALKCKPLLHICEGPNNETRQTPLDPNESLKSKSSSGFPPKASLPRCPKALHHVSCQKPSQVTKGIDLSVARKLPPRIISQALTGTHHRTSTGELGQHQSTTPHILSGSSVSICCKLILSNIVQDGTEYCLPRRSDDVSRSRPSTGNSRYTFQYR
ncbi:uncharacterized protein B0I36DRAFT_121678 [Microdochium trichocladiopsis]|uniref:Uncharacterized protein n=1 Tax=Microdochium trichocladiopsis TaxID=1682393 RepID=A0A9P8Y9V3_9PEZI|nr:uncharacterized protein B0I36DRAFT_121678 [Microdochium trichocladiopsis]KAH7031335.1 hypothetical protein B0I36DRAFT_121678 [Microdochium trichocladiopsis]